MSSLPELPPKDFLKKVFASLRNNPSFMNEREDGLGELLKAMVALDPALRNPELREFLGVTCCPVGLADLVNAAPTEQKLCAPTLLESMPLRSKSAKSLASSAA
jgi:hypothetical protein